MQVLVDDRPFAVPASAVTVGELLALMRSEEPDRLVVRLCLDDEVVDGDQLSRVRGLPLDGPGRLELETASFRRLSADVLGEAVAGLGRARGRYERIADLLAAGENPEAMTMLGECLAAWGSAEQALRHALGAAAGLAGGADVPADLSAALQEILPRVQQALKARDYVAIGDLLTYELPEVSDRWEQGLIGLRERLLAGDA